MASSPRKRARTEAAAAGEGVRSRARPVDEASRRACVARAAVVGDVLAAAEFGVAVSTVRSWRKRLGGAEAASAASAEAVLPDAGPLPAGLEGKRATLREAEAIVDESARRTRELQARGLDVAAREAAATGKLWSAAAKDLEGKLALAQESAVRIQQAEVEAMAEALGRFMALLGVPWRGRATQRLFGKLLREEPDLADAVEAAAGEVRRHFAGVLGQAAAPGASDGEDEDDVDPETREADRQEPAAFEDAPATAEPVQQRPAPPARPPARPPSAPSLARIFDASGTGPGGSPRPSRAGKWRAGP